MKHNQVESKAARAMYHTEQLLTQSLTQRHRLPRILAIVIESYKDASKPGDHTYYMRKCVQPVLCQNRLPMCYYSYVRLPPRNHVKYAGYHKQCSHAGGGTFNRLAGITLCALQIFAARRQHRHVTNW